MLVDMRLNHSFDFCSRKSGSVNVQRMFISNFLNEIFEVFRGRLVRQKTLTQTMVKGFSRVL